MGPLSIAKTIKNMRKDWSFESFEEDLSLLTFKVTYKAFNFASRVKCIPIEPIPGAPRKYRIFQKPTDWLIYYGISLGCWISLIHQVLGFALYFAEKGLNPQSVIHMLYLLLYFLFGVMHVAIHFQTLEAVDMINHTEGLMSTLHGRGDGAWADEEYDPKFHKGKWHSHPVAILVVLYVGATLASIVLTFGVLHVFNPTGEMYVLSRVAHLLTDIHPWLVLLVSLAFESVLMGMVVIISYVPCIVGVIGNSVGFTSLWVMSNTSRERPNWIPSWHLDRYKAFIYSELYHKIVDSFTQRTFYPGSVLLQMTFTIICWYVATSAFHILPIMLYLLFPVSGMATIIGMVVGYGAAAKVCVQGVDVIEAMKHHHLRARITLGRGFGFTASRYEARKRELESLRSFGFHVGNFGIIETETPMTCVNECIDYILLLHSY